MPREVYRGKYRVFVGNTQEISAKDLEAKFGEFGKVIECDLKGAYGFVGYDDEDEANRAVDQMDRKEYQGRNLNVEISGGRPRTNAKNGKDTTKLHVSGMGYNVDVDELKAAFMDHAEQVDVHPMQNKDICFVHVDEKSAEICMTRLSGRTFGKGKLKIEYGSLSKKPVYDKNSRKIILHIANLPDASLDHSDILLKKFDLFGSVEDGQIIKSKAIAFIKIDERYAERAVQSLNNCFFFGAQIKVQFSKQNDNQRNTDNHRSSSDHRRQNLPSGLSGINVESREFDRFDPPPSRASAPSANQSARFVIDDFSQLSGQRPSCPMPRRDEIDQLITRRKRLETIHPYERTLLTYAPDARDLPPPPPEFLRLIRDRTEIKARILLHRAEEDGKLSLLSGGDDEYGFNSRPRSPHQYQRRSYDRPPADSYAPPAESRYQFKTEPYGSSSAGGAPYSSGGSRY